MTVGQINPSIRLLDPKTGLLTAEGVRFFGSLTQTVTVAGSLVSTTAVQTLTNKTMDGDVNVFVDIHTSSLKNRTGVDTDLVTGTEGASGELGQWNTDGDLVGVDPASLTAVIGAQPADATLTALAAFNTDGILTQTAADTFVARTITGTANEIDIADGDGVAGDPTASLPAAMTLTGKTLTGGSYTGAAWDNGVIGGGTPAAMTGTTITATSYVKAPSYTVLGVPSAVTSGAGAIIYVSDESGGAVLAFSDATNWLRVTDRAIIS